MRKGQETGRTGERRVGGRLATIFLSVYFSVSSTSVPMPAGGTDRCLTMATGHMATEKEHQAEVDNDVPERGGGEGRKNKEVLKAQQREGRGEEKYIDTEAPGSVGKHTKGFVPFGPARCTTWRCAPV